MTISVMLGADLEIPARFRICGGVNVTSHGVVVQEAPV